MLLAATSAALAQTTTNFAFTGGAQTYTMPAGVARLRVMATGGRGGRGLGAGVQAIVTMVPGEVLTVQVGGQGSSGGNGRISKALIKVFSTSNQ